MEIISIKVEYTKRRKNPKRRKPHRGGEKEAQRALPTSNGATNTQSGTQSLLLGRVRALEELELVRVTHEGIREDPEWVRRVVLRVPDAQAGDELEELAVNRIGALVRQALVRRAVRDPHDLAFPERATLALVEVRAEVLTIAEGANDRGIILDYAIPDATRVRDCGADVNATFDIEPHLIIVF